MSTTYRLHHSVESSADGIALRLQVGQRDRLEPLPLTRTEALRLAIALLTALQRAEAKS